MKMVGTVGFRAGLQELQVGGHLYSKVHGT